MDRTISMTIALEQSKETQHDLGEVGFIMTVLRDNTSDDFVYEVLNNLIINAKSKY
ncbi:MAG: hypothetical protein ABS939_00765 [Psychrobacillus sp.]